MLILCLAVGALFLPSTTMAQGWNDFVLPIADGYQIFKANYMEVCLSRSDGKFLYHPGNYNDTGPIFGFANLPSVIFFRTYGRRERNLFEGDTISDIDSSKIFYFILEKSGDRITGPLPQTAFDGHPLVTPHLPITWVRPKNPDFWRPLAGNAMFLVFSIPFLVFGFVVRFCWVSIPLLIIAIGVFVMRMKRKRQNQSLESTR